MIIRLRPAEDHPYGGWDVQIDNEACPGFLLLRIVKGKLWRYWKRPSDAGDEDTCLEPKPTETTATRSNVSIYDLAARGHWQVRCAIPLRSAVAVTYLDREVSIGSSQGFMIHVPVDFKPRLWNDEPDSSFWSRLGGVEIEDA